MKCILTAYRVAKSQGVSFSAGWGMKENAFSPPQGDWVPVAGQRVTCSWKIQFFLLQSFCLIPTQPTLFCRVFIGLSWISFLLPRLFLITSESQTKNFLQLQNLLLSIKVRQMCYLAFLRVVCEKAIFLWIHSHHDSLGTVYVIHKKFYRQNPRFFQYLSYFVVFLGLSLIKMQEKTCHKF